MRYIINYTALCNQGKVRVQNQDNFWCVGAYLNSENAGLESPLYGSTDIRSCHCFAVFDGMGGEKKGEMAAYLAAKTFDGIISENPKRINKEYLINSCLEMNRIICKYARENRIRTIGTTAAVLVYFKNKVFILNIGDSKIFRWRDEDLVQISVDHVMLVSGDRKPALTQSLGIPEDEYLIEPHISEEKFKSGDRYLICSDGLTDMVNEEIIRQILKDENNNLKCASTLLDKALENGGIDNTTIILCDIDKKRWRVGAK